MNRHALLAMILGSVALVAGCTSGTDNTDSTSTGTPTNSGTADGGANDDGLKAQALALYTSKPFNTITPEHTWLETGDGRMTFLHWNDADPAKATGLLFCRRGIQGQVLCGRRGRHEGRV